nr:MAG TPA: hypothetical protein [Bacteriophage sp.]
MVKFQSEVGSLVIDFCIGNIQNTGNAQQPAFNLADTNHKGFRLIRPTFCQFCKITFNGFRHISRNIVPIPITLVIQRKGQIHRFFLNTFHPNNMTDGGNSNAFPRILKGINGGLNLFHQGRGRNRESAVDDHQLHSSANGQFIVLGGIEHRIQPAFHRFRNIRKTADPFRSSFRGNHFSRGKIAVPSPVNLHTTHAGNGVDLFNIVNTVSAEGLGVQAVEITLSENLGIFFIFTRNQNGSNGASLKAIHIFNGDHRSGVVVPGFTSRFTGQFIITIPTISGNIVIQFTDGKAGIHGKKQGCGSNRHLQNCGACRLRGKAPFTGSLNQIGAACGISKGFIQYRIKGNIQILQFHSGGGVPKPHQRSFTGVKIAVDRQRLLKHPGKDHFIGLHFIH